MFAASAEVGETDASLNNSDLNLARGDAVTEVSPVAATTQFSKH